MRQVLVASRVALAMIMRGGAGLLARTRARLEQQDLGVLFLFGAVAAFLPARRATRIDPVQALRA